ncbi:uncharacterized protein [Nicotiana sylvestris]|uniref:uncharacterized protein n=1 Tax=Nicotiana sylvestris TaxID=4096 RepID=UPI00388CED02
MLSWIMNCVSLKLLCGIVYSSNASAVWNDLKERFDKVDLSRIFQIHKDIATINQVDKGTEMLCGIFSDFCHFLDLFSEQWEKNAKAKKCLVCGLSPDEYSRIQSCTTAKEIWDTLQVAHEGTPQVKRSRGTLLYSQYENFTMKDGETIKEMYTRFTTLTNEFKSLGRVILEEDKVEKILTRVLPVAWESKITAIQESKNMATLRLDELIRNLTSYELRRQTRKMDTPKKERSLALKITEGSDLEDDDMDMITRDFKKYLMRGNGSSRGTNFNKIRAPEKQTNDGCYKCGKTDYMIKNCPQC